MAERIAEYAALGIDEFVLSGYPHLEELYWFGEGAVPQLTRAGLFAPAAAPAPASTALADTGNHPFLPAAAAH